jgi:mono/diheme cytochrome c family protein
MIPMNGNDDEWIASIASFIRNNFGNQASFVSPADVARVRAKTKDHTGLLHHRRSSRAAYRA